jgi:hypothetical protein
MATFGQLSTDPKQAQLLPLGAPEPTGGALLELLDGANLLHLLAEHASIEARIVMPEGWVDLPVHGE